MTLKPLGFEAPGSSAKLDLFRHLAEPALKLSSEALIWCDLVTAPCRKIFSAESEADTDGLHIKDLKQLARYPLIRLFSLVEDKIAD